MGRRKELIWPDGPMSFAVFFVTGTTSKGRELSGCGDQRGGRGRGCEGFLAGPVA